MNMSEGSRSLWMEVSLPTFSALDKQTSADVCIVGAGIVGLTCAYTLAKAGKSVIVVEQGSIACGQTSRTTAHLTWALDDRYFHLSQLFGNEGARIIAESHAAAIDYIEQIVRAEKIECDFERLDGYLYVPPGQSKHVIEQELYAVQKLGMPISKVPRAPNLPFDTGSALCFPNQGQVHILKYLNGLVKAIVEKGGRIYEQTHVSYFQDGSPCILKTKDGFTISAQSTIVATCSPVNNRFMIHTKQTAYRTYVIAATIPKGAVKGLFWDTLDPYHYIRVQTHLSDPTLDWLLVGGEDHKTGQETATNQRYEDVETWARQHFPMMGEVMYRWSGQVFEPCDSIGFIGRNPTEQNTYIATGDSGNGITHGTIAGMLIPDLILGKTNAWYKQYEPSRKTLGAALEFLKENANVALQYGDWLTEGEAKAINSMPNNSGIVLREGLKKIAVYRDHQGEVHILSACCPHLGGCVRWNPSEESWDCPCHGSRFDGHGKVITGPALSDLSAYHQPLLGLNSKVNPEMQ